MANRKNREPEYDLDLSGFQGNTPESKKKSKLRAKNLGHTRREMHEADAAGKGPKKALKRLRKRTNDGVAYDSHS